MVLWRYQGVPDTIDASIPRGCTSLRLGRIVMKATWTHLTKVAHCWNSITSRDISYVIYINISIFDYIYLCGIVRYIISCDVILTHLLRGIVSNWN